MTELQAGDGTPATAAPDGPSPAAAVGDVAQAGPAGGKRLLAQTLLLVLSQFLTTPLAVLVNAVLARSLGADDFGTIYLASTLAGFGFLLVDWGQQATIPARVALRRGEAAETLGTSLALKLGATVLVSVGLVLAARVLGYPRAVFIALGLTIVQQTFVSVASNFTSLLRGFERLDWVSGFNIASNLLTAALVIPVALLGGRLVGTLQAQAVGALLALLVAAWLVARLKLPPARASKAMARALMHSGGAFVMFNLVLAVQPNVDGVILSHLASAETVGWYAAARRLVGVLIFPATTVGFALFPTMSRLYAENRPRFTSLTGTTLRLVIVIGVCASVGTCLFADVAVQVVYSRKSFGGTVADLQVLSVFVFLLYFTLILGSAIAAAGKQAVWAGAQSLCILVSAIGDPLLIPVCARRFGNGGLGVCITAVLSELLMVVAAMIILRGQGLIRPAMRGLPAALAGGAAMWLSARLLGGLPAPVGMAGSVLAYGVAVVALGGIDREHLALIRDVVRAKSRRAAGGAP